MKKITELTLLIVTLFLFSNKAEAQTDYTYTLIHNGGYSFSVAAVPSTTTSSFATSVQSYTLVLFTPTGVTYTVNSSLANAPAQNTFPASAVGGSAMEDGHLVSNVPGAPFNIAAPDSASNPVIFYTFTLNGTPTTGNLRLMANNDPEAGGAFGLASVVQGDSTDDGSASYRNLMENTASGLSGITTFNLATLGTTNNELDKVAIYPNPVKDVLNIKGLNNELQKAVIYNVNGQKVITQTSNLETINTSALTSGIYFVQLETANSTKTIKLIKQ